MIFETLRKHNDPFGQMNITLEAISRANEEVIQEEIVDYYDSARWTHNGVLEVADDNLDAIEVAKDLEAALLNDTVLCDQAWSEIEYDLITDRIEHDYAIADVLRSGGASYDLAHAIDGGEIDPECFYSQPIVEALYMHRLDVPREDARNLVADLRTAIQKDYGTAFDAACRHYISLGHNQDDATKLANEVCEDQQRVDCILGSLVLGAELELS